MSAPPETATLAPGRTVGWASFCLIYSLGLVAGSAYGMAGPLVGEVAATLGASVASVGLVLILLPLPSVVLSAAVGAAVDRLGSRTVMLVGAVLMVIADGLQLAANTLAWFAWDLLLQGIAVSFILSAGQVMISRAFRGPVQTRALSIWSTVNFVGYAAGLLASGIAASGPGWRSAFQVQAVVAAAMALGTTLLPRVTQATATGRPAIGRLLQETAALRICFALGASAVAGVGTNAGVSLYLHNAHHIPLRVAASAAALGNIICIPGALIIGWMLSRGRSALHLMFGITTVAIISGTLVYIPFASFGLAVTALYAYQLCLSAATALTYAAMPVALRDRSQLGTATGLLLQIGGAGGMIGPTLFFAIMAAGDWRLLAATLVALWLVALLMFPLRQLGPGSRR